MRVALLHVLSFLVRTTSLAVKGPAALCSTRDCGKRTCATRDCGRKAPSATRGLDRDCGRDCSGRDCPDRDCCNLNCSTRDCGQRNYGTRDCGTTAPPKRDCNAKVRSSTHSTNRDCGLLTVLEFLGQPAPSGHG